MSKLSACTFADDIAAENHLPTPVLVHAGSAYLFRAGSVAIRVTESSRMSTSLDADALLSAADLLASTGIEVVRPRSLRAIHGHDHSATLWEWEDTQDQHSPSEWASLGVQLTLLHNTPVPLRLPDLEVVLTNELLSLIEILCIERPSGIDSYDIAMLEAKLAAMLPKIPSAAAGEATLHGDFHHDNILFTDCGPVISDLEDLCLGNPLYDIAAIQESVLCYGLDSKALDLVLAASGLGLDQTEQTEETLAVLVRARQLRDTLRCLYLALRDDAFVPEATKRILWWNGESGEVWSDEDPTIIPTA